MSDTQDSLKFGRKYGFFLTNDDLTKVDLSSKAIPTNLNYLDLSNLHFTFNVTRGDYQAPNTCVIQVSNVSRETIKKIQQNKYKYLVLQAGYSYNLSVIFFGEIAQFKSGRLSSTDTYVEFTAIEGDEFYNFSPISASFLANMSVIDSLDRVTGQITKAEVAKNFNQLLTSRGRAYWGTSAAIIRMLTSNLASKIGKNFSYENVGVSWFVETSISGGKYQGSIKVIPNDHAFLYEVPIINYTTGLIGIPEQVNNGISFRCLLDPKMRVGGLVYISNDDLNKYSWQTSTAAVTENIEASLKNKLDYDGFYYVMQVNHSGSNRQTEWYSDVLCMAGDALQMVDPKTLAVTGINMVQVITNIPENKGPYFNNVGVQKGVPKPK